MLHDPAIALGRQGYKVVVGARRVERLTRVAGEEGVALRLDVTDEDSVRDFVRDRGPVNWQSIEPYTSSVTAIYEAQARGVKPIAEKPR